MFSKKIKYSKTKCILLSNLKTNIPSLFAVWIYVLAVRSYLYLLNPGNNNNIEDHILFPFFFSLGYMFLLYLMDLLPFNFLKLLKPLIIKLTFVTYLYILYFFTEVPFSLIVTFHVIISIGLILKTVLFYFNIQNNKYIIVAMYIFCCLFLVVNSSRYFSHPEEIKENLWIDEYGEDLFYNSAFYYNYVDKDAVSKYLFLPVYRWKGDPPVPRNQGPSPSNVYPDVSTHYPALPETILTLLVKIIGRDDTLISYRFFPFLLYIISFYFIARYFILICKTNKINAFVFALLGILIPAIDHAKFTFFLTSYAYLVYFIILYFSFKYVEDFSKNVLYLVFIFGFIQLWISWDYLPLTVLTTLFPVFLPFTKNNKNFTKKLLNPFFIILLACITGAVFRIIHHSIYFQSLFKTFTDFYEQFISRTAGNNNSWVYITNILKRIIQTNLDKHNLGFDISLLLFIFTTGISIFALSGCSIFIKKTIYLDRKYFTKLSIYCWLVVLTIFIWFYIFRFHTGGNSHNVDKHFMIVWIAILSIIATTVNTIQSTKKS